MSVQMSPHYLCEVTNLLKAMQMKGENPYRFSKGAEYDGMACTCNLNTWEADARGLKKFMADLCYIVNS